MKKKLITLANELDFTTETEYFDYLIDSHINGNFSSCKRLFADMSRANQKQFLMYCVGFSNVYQFYFDLL